MACSNEPQQIKAHGDKAKWWYYEYPGSIEIVVPHRVIEERQGKGLIIRIPRRMLSAYLKRVAQ